MLKIENLTAGYDKKDVIFDISLTANKGKVICILGQNASGKTTLFKAIYNLINYQGKVKLNEKDLKSFSSKELAKLIGMVGQNDNMHFDFTVFQTALMGRYSHTKNSLFSSYSKEDENITTKALEKLDILHLKDRYLNTLSQGQRQRVFLARVFSQNPEVLLLDEAINHLDLKYKIETMDFVKQWTQKNEKITICIIHDINLALNYADEIVFLKQGRIIQHTKTKELDKELLNKVYDANITNYLKKTSLLWLSDDK